MVALPREKRTAAAAGLFAAGGLSGLIWLGSRSLAHFDAALVAYTFATLFATFGNVYRYTMWLQRPPTRMYFKRGWQIFLRPSLLARNLAVFLRRVTMEFALNRFIWQRGRRRWIGHWFIMWGCVLAVAITFPLVFGWVHFETPAGRFDQYVVYLFGFPTQTIPIHSLPAFLMFHGLVWASILVILGVMMAMWRRMRDHGAAAVQQFGEDFLPLIMLFAISITGLMLTASYTWMRGYAYDFLAILHAITVIFTLLWLPFGKFFHIFQRPAQLGVSFYKDLGALTPATCRRCGGQYASTMMIQDLITVERQLGFTYECADAGHYQEICPACRRAMFGLAQGALWDQRLSERLETPATIEMARTM